MQIMKDGEKIYELEQELSRIKWTTRTSRNKEKENNENK